MHQPPGSRHSIGGACGKDSGGKSDEGLKGERSGGEEVAEFSFFAENSTGSRLLDVPLGGFKLARGSRS